MSWLCVAEELFRRRGPGSVRFLAPDLRGRADSRSAPGPYGLGTHAADVLAIADVFGARPVLVGHSMGAFVTALASSRAPERVAGSVLVDGGFAFPPPAEFDIDAALTAVIGPAMTRLSMRFASPEAYLDFWRVHPALGPELSGPQAPEVRHYALHDLVKTDAGYWVSSCVLDAIRPTRERVLGGRQQRWIMVHKRPRLPAGQQLGRRAQVGAGATAEIHDRYVFALLQSSRQSRGQFAVARAMIRCLAQRQPIRRKSAHPSISNTFGIKPGCP